MIAVTIYVMDPMADLNVEGLAVGFADAADDFVGRPSSPEDDVPYLITVEDRGDPTEEWLTDLLSKEPHPLLIVVPNDATGD